MNFEKKYAWLGLAEIQFTILLFIFTVVCEINIHFIKHSNFFLAYSIIRATL